MREDAATIMGLTLHGGGNSASLINASGIALNCYDVNFAAAGNALRVDDRSDIELKNISSSCEIFLDYGSLDAEGALPSLRETEGGSRSSVGWSRKFGDAYKAIRWF